MPEKSNGTPAADEMDTAISAVSGSFKLSLWVPSEAVGKVIGKKGAVIQHIQRESGALCAIVSEDRDRDKKGEGDRDQDKKGGASLWSPIVITATPSKARAAHDMILDVVEEIDDAVAELNVPMHKLPPSHLHGLLRSTGYPSDAVKLLSAETGVRIFVSDRRDSVSYRGRDSQSHSSHSHSNVMSITLEGSVPAVFQALKSFAETLGSTHKSGSSSHSPIPQPEGGCRFIGDESKEKSNSTTSNNSSSNKDNWRHRDKDSDGADHQADYEQHVNVPTTLVGLLFAKRDPDPNVLKQIQRGTRTQLEKLPEPIVPSSHQQQQDDSADKKVGEDVKGSKDVNKKTQHHAAVVTFAVRGGSAAAVELGASCLLRIVAGDKIVTVLSDLSANKGQERHRTTVTDVSSSTQSRKEVVPVQEEDQENVAAASISGKGAGRGSGRGGKNMRGGKGGKGKPYAGRGGGKHTESDSGTGGRKGGVKAAAKAGV